jgi:hypothetical protein
MRTDEKNIFYVLLQNWYSGGIVLNSSHPVTLWIHLLSSPSVDVLLFALSVYGRAQCSAQ